MSGIEDPRRAERSEGREGETDSDVEISAHRSCSNRTVFVENGNSDGWISTDTTVELRR